jgi:hypothetical protein
MRLVFLKKTRAEPVNRVQHRVPRQNDVDCALRLNSPSFAIVQKVA